MGTPLNDDELGQFLDQGYLVLIPDDLPAGIHGELFDDAQPACAARERLDGDLFGLELIADRGEIACASDKVVATLGDEKSEVRAAAVKALGRIARKALACRQTHWLQPIVTTIGPTTDPTREPDMPNSVVPMNRVRQTAAPALLAIATEAVLTNFPAAALAKLAATLADIARRDSDRYAQGSAIEATLRLPHAGIPESAAVVAELLRNRWNVTPAAAVATSSALKQRAQK